MRISRIGPGKPVLSTAVLGKKSTLVGKGELLAATISGIWEVRVRIMRQVVVSRGEDGYWVAQCLSLPGCISQGRTREEAIENIKEAIDGYIAALAEDELPVPREHFDTLVVAV